MENEEHHRGEDDDKQFQAVFGVHANISHGLRCIANNIRNNDPNTTRFSDENFGPNDIDQLSDLAWDLLGRYIGNNTYLQTIDLED